MPPDDPEPGPSTSKDAAKNDEYNHLEYIHSEAEAASKQKIVNAGPTTDQGKNSNNAKGGATRKKYIPLNKCVKNNSTAKPIGDQKADLEKNQHRKWHVNHFSVNSVNDPKNRTFGAKFARIERNPFFNSLNNNLVNLVNDTKSLTLGSRVTINQGPHLQRHVQHISPQNLIFGQKRSNRPTGNIRNPGPYQDKRPPSNQNNFGKQGYQNRVFLIGFKFLEQTLAKPPADILKVFANKKSEFDTFFNTSMKNTPDLMVLVIKILSKACETTFENTKSEILSSACNSKFITELKEYIVSLALQHVSKHSFNKLYYNDVDSFWKSIILFFDTVIVLIPNTACDKLFEVLQACKMNVEVNSSSGKITEDTKLKFEKLMTKFTLCFEERLKKKEKLNIDDENYEEPPENFRTISVYPKSEDIVSNEKVFLRPNITQGAYHSVEHYLDVQFRLLREDFICPLRDGITDTFFNDATKNKRRFNTGVRVYPRTKFVSPHITTNCVGILLDFQADKRTAQGKLRNKNEIKWEQSKRFMFGSLLCFTRDKFNTILFGTVADRNLKLLQEGYIVVKICEQYVAQENLLYEKEFLMVENEVYFEPYYHVLRALQTMNEDNFPMQNYLVDVQAESRQPQYVNADTQYQCNNKFINVMDIDNWPPAEELNLNDSQYRAFQLALTKEFAIIQGPPGTGKTYLGLKVASTLLKNLHNKQMLVVCYTNHALDQFLEGLMSVTEKIIRVGNRSKNEKLDHFNLSRRGGRLSRGSFIIKDRINEVVIKLQKKVRDLEKLNMYDGIIDITRTDIFPQLKSESFFPRCAQKNFSRFVYWLLGIGFKSGDDSNLNKIPEHNNQLRVDNDMQQENIVEDFNFDDELDDIHRPVYDNDLEYENIENVSGDFKYAVSVYELDKLLVNLYEEIFHLEDVLKKGQAVNNVPPDLYDELYKKNMEYNDRLNVHRVLKMRLQQLTEYKIGNMRNAHEILDRKGSNCNTEERWSIYAYCLYRLHNRIMRHITNLNSEYRRLYKLFEDQKHIDDLSTLEEADVIGMTTTSAARLQSVLQHLKIPIVIIEEAAEVPESHIIVSLSMHCEHLILIGDHQQLKPSTAAFKLAKKYNLDISLFERMLNNGMHCARLDVQHRMRPEICSLISPNIYENLENHQSVKEFPEVLGMKNSLFFVKHNVFEDNLNNEDTITRRNIHEAKFITRLCRHLILQGYDPEEITILTTYTGQMFLIKGECKMHNILDGVKITVVDNYQGEENKIILLSLVRSNNEANIGFLKTENRVCVALSRAKIGFYIIGNMDNLVSNSTIWPKIDETLQKMAAIDTHLVLCCQLHPDMETRVACAEDFDKAPEGGCSRLCYTLLKCGHYCKSICHINDREHEFYKCKEPCDRSCKRDHPCQNLCFQDCNDCRVIIPKELKCGHTHNLKCGYDREKFSCPVLVKTILPHCKHEVMKPCYADPEKFPCCFPCENRLDCGHKCERRCHLLDDPDHTDYKCNKPCAKLYKGCTQDHACEKLCFEDCPPCNIQVKKTHKNCSHSKRMACAEDIDARKCIENCKRILSCGHYCKLKCSDPCGDCKQKVKKVIEECKHTVNLFCHLEPVIKNCDKSCVKKLPCGHDCKELCRNDCTKECKVLVKSDTILSACGHFANVPCYQSKISEVNFTSIRFLDNCKEKCKVALRCGHICSGTCAECFQGRIHKPCGEACGNTLVCQHSCKVPCREYCPPCTEKCTYRCAHSKCSKMCGIPCVICQEPCDWKCEHKKCTRKCGQICNRDGCDEPCLQAIKCGHLCIGICGEKCPTLCRICNEEEVKTIFFGNEDEEDARFIMLEECNHIFEVKGLDEWFSIDNSQEISPKQCPKCKTIINLTPRYATACKMAYENINRVKKKIFGTVDDNKEKREDVVKKIDELVNASLDFCKVSSPYKRLINDIKAKTQKTIKKKKQILSFNDIIQIDRICVIMTKINEIYQGIKILNTLLNSKFIKHCDLIINIILKAKFSITDQFVDDIKLELSRLHWIAEFYKIETSVEYLAHKTNQKVEESYRKCDSTIMTISKFSPEKAVLSDHYLAELLLTVKSSRTITAEDKEMIIRAMNLGKKGHWYACPNDHIYCITECGGAMVESKCPECGARIGGGNHRLRDDNRVATEMDGATRPAFS